MVPQITDSQGKLQYIPFPVCNETSRPLELPFGIEKGNSVMALRMPPQLTIFPLQT